MATSMAGPQAIPPQLLTIQVPEGQEPEWLRLVRAAELRASLVSDPEVPEAFHPGTADTSGLVQKLKAHYGPEQVASEDLPGVDVWHRIGLCYLYLDQFPDALAVFLGLYEQMLAAQGAGGRVHKGLPLVRLHDCFYRMGFRAHSQRYAMLSLCEDAIKKASDASHNDRGSRWRLLRREGLPQKACDDYFTQAQAKASQPGAMAQFPEWVLQQLDQNWLKGPPSEAESQAYYLNQAYANHLVGTIEARTDSSGGTLELLADYVVSCMAGARTARNCHTPSTQYDVVACIEGAAADFRSEFGRYFICECKDWRVGTPGFSEFAKFCRVLDSAKARFGVFLSQNGISGAGGATDASREQLKVFQDRGIVIVVLDLDDLTAVADGANLIALLRAKYENVRLDIVCRPEAQLP